MSLHRITAGSGYDYLTRQVAAMDSTEKGHAGLASYYDEKGEAPGQWAGSGMVGIDGLEVGDVVTAEQMQSLFGSGHHPLAEQRQAAIDGPGVTEEQLVEAARLGKPYKVFDNDISPFRIEVARRLEALNKQQGLPRKAAVAIEDRARIRTEVALGMFRDTYRRDPLDQRELAGWVAKLSRQQTTAVAGFDLTFSPVKSVSTLWAVADPHLAGRIEEAHQAAVGEALAFIEQHALFTRTGRNGVRQVEVRGLVAAAFTHRDSRAGDPDLHTHVAVANKVQTVADGRWLSIDGRILHKAVVAASETYNTALERHLAASIGVRFQARDNPDPRKRPVREVAGVDARLNDRWSTRRRSIEARRRELAANFQRDHGRPPSPVEAIALAQQATLETREAKHEPRSLAEQRTAWHAQAVEVLGGQQGVDAMIRTALHPTARTITMPDEAWMERAAHIVVDQVQQRRSVWQSWHLRAEALRAARSMEIPAEQVDGFVDQLVARAVAVCTPLTKPVPGEPAEPDALRRSDGSSVYSVAGAQQFTSTAVLDAEARLVSAAARNDGKRVPETVVDLALLEAEANGQPLNPGQVLLVREMAGSGARVQLAIAPAGSGKTTAMNALSRAWVGDGGTVVGLAPSAAAAAQLGEQMVGHTDTLAKLAWSITHGDQPDWMAAIGPDTLVIIDEAGMADTLALDAVVDHVLQRGASVRLIGDDQQLAAIGAGGVLRDIHANHGALRLSELVRFTDRAEGSASLALRQGQVASLGFYLDQRRLHVGDQTTMADDLFATWSADVARGMDSIMLAPTRDLVAELNQRARSQRLAGDPPGRSVELADGNQASVGDTIITRSNNRSLRTGTTDWVKNGDRWMVAGVEPDGALHASHTRTGRRVLLPADYVAEQVELGYACTTHTAQGVTADTMHGLLSGNESRQQAYTMLTRGREANHAYVVVVGDGDPHTVIHSDTINPPSPTDVLERILARDESPISASTTLREADNPRVLLGQATARYSDAVGYAARHIAGDHGVQALDERAEQALPRVTAAASWPVLQAQLLAVAADGTDPIQALAKACEAPLTDTRDPCTVLAWRISQDRQLRHPGPLPWLPGIPGRLATDPVWGEYLQARSALVADLAGQVRTASLDSSEVPGWTGGLVGRPPAELIADVEVWRCANQVEASDTRPTGELLAGMAELRWQRHLTRRLATCQSAALDEWRTSLDAIASSVLDDTFAPILAARLSQLASSGIDAAGMLRTAAQAGPLPDDHAAAALWWRLARQLTPAVAEAVDGDHHVSTAWLDTFTAAIGKQQARDLENSPWWPALVTTIERGLQRGWQLQQLIDEAAPLGADGHTDLCQAWVWRLSLLTDTHEPDPDEPPAPTETPPEDLWDGWEPAGPVVDVVDPTCDEASPAEAVAEPEPPEPDWGEVNDDTVLAFEAMVRGTLGAPEPDDADIAKALARRDEIADSPVPPARLAQVNALAADFYRHQLPGSWALPYLTDRFGTDPAALQAGYAPDQWTALVAHLRRHGVTDTEMVTAGLASVASTGRLIDRFRDRAVLPIIHNAQVLGFVGRRHPHHRDEDRKGPKYLNTATTPLYSKGEQLFIAGDLHPGHIPVLVEGPMDAWAITLAGHGRYVGAAPLGTSLTENHVAQLHRHGQHPIVATDNDLAGRLAAERDYWLLSMYQLDPRHAALPAGADPADLLAGGRGDQLHTALTTARRLADDLVDERLSNLQGAEAIVDAVRVVAAEPGTQWGAGAAHIAERTGVPDSLVRAALAPMVRSWNRDVRKAALQALHDTAKVKQRLLAQQPVPPQRASAADVARPETERAERRGVDPSRRVER